MHVGKYVAYTYKCYHQMVVYVRQPLGGGQGTKCLLSWSCRFIVAYGLNMELRLQRWGWGWGWGGGWVALELPPCSPDLNPCDYNLIPRPKQTLQGELPAKGEDVLTVGGRLVARISAFGNADGAGRGGADQRLW